MNGMKRMPVMVFCGILLLLFLPAYGGNFCVVILFWSLLFVVLSVLQYSKTVLWSKGTKKWLSGCVVALCFSVLRRWAVFSVVVLCFLLMPYPVYCVVLEWPLIERFMLRVVFSCLCLSAWVALWLCCIELGDFSRLHTSIMASWVNVCACLCFPICVPTCVCVCLFSFVSLSFCVHGCLAK